ncbi:MAG: glycosyltransferase [Burkholderiales bacterium]|nr:glycosyltransferase [Burkholderiales bacterium]
MKIAVVCDWLVTVGGSEKVLEQILMCYPDADLFSIVDFLPHNQRDIIMNKPVTTSFIQKLPFAKTRYRAYLPLMPLAIEQFDLSSYELIISSSHAVAKGVITGPNQLHICYCHSPMRYAWDLQHQYLRESNLICGLKSWIARYMLHKLRLWDLRTSNSVDYFIANSNFIAKRIHKFYRREAAVIYPPVEVNVALSKPMAEREEFYITVSRMVPYKKIDIIIEAFLHSPQRKLIVIGDGPMYKNLCKKVNEVTNITLLGYQSNKVISEYLNRANGFVFAAEEDFGIVPVEALAHGVPVIAYGKGGVLESVVDKGNNPCGVFFHKQEWESIIMALDYFEANRNIYTPHNCILNAQKFAIPTFRKKFSDFVSSRKPNRGIFQLVKF